MSVFHLLDLNTDLLQNCLQFLSLDELRSLDKTTLFSTKHNQLLKAMEDVLINNDLEKPIDIQLYRWLTSRYVRLTCFHFGSGDNSAWHKELVNHSSYSFQNVKHIDFNQLLARPIYEIDKRNRSLLFILILYDCLVERPTVLGPEKGMLKTIRLGAYHDVPEASIKSMVNLHALVEHLSLTGCTEITSACIDHIKSNCQALKSFEFDQ